MTDWDKIYYLDWNFEMWNEPDDKPWIPKMVGRGAIRNRSDIYRLFTAHYPQGYLYPPPDKKPTLVRAPMIVPDLKSPAKVILYPKIRKVSLKIDLAILKPPKQYCSILGNTPQYNGLYYTTPVKTGRKPLQFLVLGTVLAGAIMGAITGGGVSAAMLEPIKAEIKHIQETNRMTSEALAAISDSIDSLNLLTQQMRSEIEIIKREWQNHQSWNEMAIRQNHNQIMCLQYFRAIDQAQRELDTLFVTGIGRQTPEFQTLLDPNEESTCENGFCNLNVLQIFTHNAFHACHTRPVPQRWDSKIDPWKGLSYTTWVTPMDHFLWINMNGTPAYIPQEECLGMGVNTFIYPHMPASKLTETRLTATTMSDTIQDMGDWTWMICSNTNKNLICTNLNRQTLNDTKTTLVINPGCWMLHNCSVVEIDNKTLVTEISIKTKHTYVAPTLQLQGLEKQHYDTFIKKTQELQIASEYNERQLQSIHEKIENAEQSLLRNKDKIHNLVGLIRTNTYIHKDWNKNMKECSFFDIMARMIRLDFVCLPVYNWWHWIKESIMIIGMLIVLIICLRFIMCCRERKKT